MRPRAAHLQRAVWLSVASIGWSAIVGTISVYAALVSGSLSLLGFGGDSVLDAVVSVTLVWRFVAEANQPERAARVERMAEGAVGIALIALAVYLVAASIRSLAEGGHPAATPASIALLVASVAILPPLAIAKSRVAAALGSGALRADSILTGVAALLAGISLASLAGSAAFGLWWADAVAALIVAAVLAREGWASVVASRSVA